MNKEVYDLSFVAFSIASEYPTVEPMGIYTFHDNSYVCGLHFQCLYWSTLCLLMQGRAALAHGISHHFTYPDLRVPGDLRLSLRMVVFHSCTYWSPDKSHFLSIVIRVLSPKPGAIVETPGLPFVTILTARALLYFIFTMLWVSRKEILDFILVLIFM